MSAKTGTNKKKMTHFLVSLCIMCMQYRGGAQYRGGIQYLGGYHEYRGGDILNTVGDILSTVGVFSTVEGYHDARGGIS